MIAASYLGSSLLHIYVDRVGANSEGEGRGPSNIFGPGAYFEGWEEGGCLILKTPGPVFTEGIQRGTNILGGAGAV